MTMPSSSSGISLSVASDKLFVKGNSISRFHSLLSITSEASDTNPERAPVFIACVLDKSGSMMGASLSKARKAATKLVKHLSEHDVLHFFAYDSNVETIFTDGDLSPSGKHGLEQRIKSINAGSATNLMAGLEVAADALKRSLDQHATTNANAGAARILLFSDGLVNTGVRDSKTITRKVRQFADAGITTSTFGIGRDFDEQLMMGIAECGRGYYGYLGTPADIPKQVGKAMHSLLALAGTSASLHISPSPASNIKARVVRVYGDPDSQENSCADKQQYPDMTTVPVGDLHIDNTRGVLVELEVDALNIDATAVKHSLDVVLEYKSAGSVIGNTTSVLLSHVQIGVSLDPDDVACGSDGSSKVSAALAIQNASDRESEIISLVQNGRYPAAISLQQRSIAELTVALELCDPASTYLLDAVLLAAKDLLVRLESKQNHDEYCLQARWCQARQRRLSMDCLDEHEDSDDDRAWSDGWSDDESCGATIPRARVWRKSSGGNFSDGSDSGSDMSDDCFDGEN